MNFDYDREESRRISMSRYFANIVTLLQKNGETKTAKWLSEFISIHVRDAYIAMQKAKKENSELKERVASLLSDQDYLAADYEKEVQWLEDRINDLEDEVNFLRVENERLKR